MIFYGVMTGNNVSTVRVLIMKRAVYAVFLNLVIIPFMTVLMISVDFAGLEVLFSLTLGTFFVGTRTIFYAFISGFVDCFRNYQAPSVCLENRNRSLYSFIIWYLWYLLCAVENVKTTIKTGGLTKMLFEEHLSYALHA